MNFPIFGSEDFRQYGYCPRKIYFRWIMRKNYQMTSKMKRGQKIHTKEVKRQEKVVTNIEKTENNFKGEFDYRYRELYLEDLHLRVKVKVDLLEIKEDKQESVGIITEIKVSQGYQGPIEEGQLLQLGIQGILVERKLNIKIKALRLHYLLDNKEISNLLDDDLRLKVLDTLSKMQKMVMLETIPRPTKNQMKCRDCECWRDCQRA